MINVDFDDLINDELPVNQRRYIITAFLKMLYRPLRNMLTTFYLFYDRIRYELAFGSTVIELEHLLNEMFDSVNRDIYITDAPEQITSFIFNESEGNEPIFLFNQSENEQGIYLYNQEEVDSLTAFIVWVPGTLSYNVDQLKALVNKYKTAGKSYIIINY